MRAAGLPAPGCDSTSFRIQSIITLPLLAPFSSFVVSHRLMSDYNQHVRPPFSGALGRLALPSVSRSLEIDDFMKSIGASLFGASAISIGSPSWDLDRGLLSVPTCRSSSVPR